MDSHGAVWAVVLAQEMASSSSRPRRYLASGRKGQRQPSQHGQGAQALYSCSRTLNRLLTGWLDGLLPEPLDDVLEREREQREELRELLERWSQ